MTTRERELYAWIQELGGTAHPTVLGVKMGISGDYAEQLCRDMVYYGWFLRDGQKFKLNPRKKFEPNPRKQETQEVQEI